MFGTSRMFVAIMVTLMSLFPLTTVVAISELEDAKETALMVEDYVERVQAEAEGYFSKGRIDKETWERYCTINQYAKTTLRTMIMAVLFYEEAPNDTHRVLISESTLSLIHILAVLDNFCNAIGIEAQPPIIC
jgi:hypothetical protein